MFEKVHGELIIEVIVPVPDSLCETIVIPRRTEIIARVKVANGVDSVQLVIEPNAFYCEKSKCTVGRCLINNGEGEVLLRNTTDDTSFAVRV